MMPRLAPFVALHHHLPLARSKSSERRQQGAAHRPSPASLFRPPSRQGRDEAPAQKRTRVGACRDPRQGPRARGERSLRGRRRRVRFAVDDSAVFVWLRRGGRRSQSEEVGRFLERGALPRRERGELAATRRACTRAHTHTRTCTHTVDGRIAQISASRGPSTRQRTSRRAAPAHRLATARRPRYRCARALAPDPPPTRAAASPREAQRRRGRFRGGFARGKKKSASSARDAPAVHAEHGLELVVREVVLARRRVDRRGERRGGRAQLRVRELGRAWSQLEPAAAAATRRRRVRLRRAVRAAQLARVHLRAAGRPRARSWARSDSLSVVRDDGPSCAGARPWGALLSPRSNDGARLGSGADESVTQSFGVRMHS